MPRSPKHPRKTASDQPAVKVLRGSRIPLEDGTVFRVIAVGKKQLGSESPWVTIQPISDTKTTIMVRRSLLQISDAELAACG